MNAPKTGKRDPVALWKAIRDSEIDDDIEEILAMSDVELDAHIRENGGDPEAIRARGEALAKDLLAKRAASDWQVASGAKLGAFRKAAAASRSKEKLPRPELLRRLEVARSDPRFVAPVAALFQKKTPEASTDEELQALLDQIDLLGTLDEE